MNRKRFFMVFLAGFLFASAAFAETNDMILAKDRRDQVVRTVKKILDDKIKEIKAFWGLTSPTQEDVTKWATGYVSLNEAQKTEEQKLAAAGADDPATQGSTTAEEALGGNESGEPTTGQKSYETSVSFLGIVGKFNLEWSGLIDNIKKLAEIQKKILEFQAKIMALPVIAGIEAAKIYLELTTALSQAMYEYGLLLAEIEKSLVVKGILAGSKVIQGLINGVLGAQDLIAQNNRAIQNAVKDHIAVWGDLTGDGVVDEKDLRSFDIGRFIAYIPAYDLDGNGFVNDTDRRMLQEAVDGRRKVFPADPKYPVGDLNGDGNVDSKDETAMKDFVSSGRKPTPQILRIADVNKDGTVDKSDQEAISKKTPSQAPVESGSPSGATVNPAQPSGMGQPMTTETE